MQFYAKDKTDQILSATLAKKQTNYSCLECGGIVRVRGGIHRKQHFYHLRRTPACRQSGKSLTHLRVQETIQSQIPECKLEKAFPQINRIADVVWESQKKIFEVQCSPISAEEVLQRNADYGKLGYEVIWILHDKRYNQWRVSAAELALTNSPFCYTDLDIDGKGKFYQQPALIENGYRIKREVRATVSLDMALDPPQKILGKKVNRISQLLYFVKRPYHLFSQLMLEQFCKD